MELCHTTARRQFVQTLATRLSACLHRCEPGKLQPYVNQFFFNPPSLFHSHGLVVFTFLSLTATLMAPAAHGTAPRAPRRAPLP